MDLPPVPDLGHDLQAEVTGDPWKFREAGKKIRLRCFPAEIIEKKPWLEGIRQSPRKDPSPKVHSN